LDNFVAHPVFTTMSKEAAHGFDPSASSIRMKQFVLAASLLLSTSAAALAQEPAPTSPPAPVAAPAPAAGQDSVKAVQRLFKSRRTGAALLAFPGGYLIGSGLVRLADGGAVSVLLGGGLAGVAFAKESRFSKKREAEIIQSYNQGKALPKNIRRRLKRKHFKA
jgi:predicted lipid-binding transport protein (Tim44 family)